MGTTKIRDQRQYIDNTGVSLNFLAVVHNFKKSHIIIICFFAFFFRVNRVEDSGMFQCMAFNELDVRYSSGQLRVLELFAPTFEKYPLEKKTYAAIGGNVTLRCRPEGAPQPKFTWRKDGNVIGKGGKYIQTENGNLFISRINRDDGGSYTCEADNEMGKSL